MGVVDAGAFGIAVQVGVRISHGAHHIWIALWQVARHRRDTDRVRAGRQADKLHLFRPIERLGAYAIDDGDRAGG